MRIFDEINPFKKGDIVTVIASPDLGQGVVSWISESSHYYEARPIASYQRFRIYVKFQDDEQRSYEIKDLEAII